MFSPEPVRIDPGGTHVYSTEQVDMFGDPFLWGITDFYVITTLDYMKPMKTDWKYEQYLRGTLRPIHRYSRVKRFESTLFQLIGERGDVDLQVVIDIKRGGYNKDPLYIWESIRMILKHRGLRKYYNRIPSIIKMLGLSYRITIADPLEVVNDFKAIHYAFERLPQSARKYFPNIRFICLKMLERHGATFGFRVPLIRTPRKLKPLQDLWMELLDSLPK
jgi:hypothetical protein